MRLTRGERRRSWLSLRRGLGGKRGKGEALNRDGGGERGRGRRSGGDRNNPGNGGRQGSERSVRQKSSASAPCLNYTSSLSASRLPVSEETLCCACVSRVLSHRRGSACESRVCVHVRVQSFQPLRSSTFCCLSDWISG